MAEKKLYKIVAFFIAILLYILFGTALISYIKESAKIVKDYGFNVDDAIVVELSNEEDKLQKKIPIKEKVIPKPIAVPPVPKIVKSEPIKKEHKVEPIILPPDPEPEPIPEKPIPVIEKKIEIEKPKDKPKKIEEKPQESRAKEEKSAKDLFSTVRTDDYDKVLEDRIKEDKARASRLKKQEAKKKAQQRAKRAKAKKERQKREKIAREAQEMVENFNLSAISSSSDKKEGEDYHEYWSKVSSKIMSKWSHTISTQDGLKAEVRIKIDNRGRLTYKVLRFSNNNLFDQKLKVFLDNLEYERFPRYKGGSSIDATFEFTDKEEG